MKMAKANNGDGPKCEKQRLYWRNKEVEQRQGSRELSWKQDRLTDDGRVEAMRRKNNSEQADWRSNDDNWTQVNDENSDSAERDR